MACFTPLPALLCPPTDPFSPPTGAVVPVVYDTETLETRPLANGESFPGYQCVEVDIVNGEFPPTNQLLNLYRDLQNRIKELEQKFCECVCTEVECPECPECPPGVLKLENIPFYDCYYTADEGSPGYAFPDPERYVTLYYVPNIIASEDFEGNPYTAGGVLITTYIEIGDGITVLDSAVPSGNGTVFLDGIRGGNVEDTPTILGTWYTGVKTPEDFLSITHVTNEWACEGS